MVSGKHFDIYNAEKGLQTGLKSLSNSDLCKENKNHIFRFINSMKANGIKAIRLRKSVSVLKDIAIITVKSCSKYNLHTIDSLIYSSAIETQSTFISADKDFSKTPKTKIIEINNNSKI